MTEGEVLGLIGQIEATIDKAEPHLEEDKFQDYCDYAYSCVAILRTILKKVKEEHG